MHELRKSIDGWIKKFFHDNEIENKPNQYAKWKHAEESLNSKPGEVRFSKLEANLWKCFRGKKKVRNKQTVAKDLLDTIKLPKTSVLEILRYGKRMN